MKIQDITNKKGSWVVTIGPKATLYEALCALIENKVGALPVLEKTGSFAGIITERDLMREVYHDADLRQKRVEEVMTRTVITGAPEDDIDYAVGQMTERRFRHMPVVRGRELVGIISIGDIVKARLYQAEFQVNQLVDYVSGPLSEGPPVPAAPVSRVT